MSIALAWDQLLHEAHGKPSWRWMNHLRLVEPDDAQPVFLASGVSAEQARFLLGRRGQLAEELHRITGRPARVDVRIADTQHPHPYDDTPTSDDPGPMTQHPQPPSARQSRPGPGIQHGMGLQQAMEMPLVRKVLENFNATILSVAADRPTTTPKEAPETLDDAETPEDEEPRD